jgi:hypothetical protein
MKNKLFAKIDSINNMKIENVATKIPVGDISQNIKNDLDNAKSDFLQSRDNLLKDFI